MTNQQLKAHCEDVIANPQDHLDWVVDMARLALASLEAEPYALLEGRAITRYDDEPLDPGCNVVYTAPPVPELKPVELPEPYDDGHGNLWLPQDAVISAVKNAGGELKS